MWFIICRNQSFIDHIFLTNYHIFIYRIWNYYNVCLLFWLWNHGQSPPSGFDREWEMKYWTNFIIVFVIIRKMSVYIYIFFFFFFFFFGGGGVLWNHGQLLHLVLIKSQRWNIAKHCVVPILSRWRNKIIQGSLLCNTNELQD